MFQLARLTNPENFAKAKSMQIITSAGCDSNSTKAAVLMTSSPQRKIIRPSTSPTSAGTDEHLGYVAQTVRQLSIRLKRVECKLGILSSERWKRHVEDVEITASRTEFRLPLESKVELMRSEVRIQHSDTWDKPVNYRYESQLFSGALAVNLRWAILRQSGALDTDESYLDSFLAQVQPTWNSPRD
ncbi:hypothetical protein EG68_11024 [Paragonimus skrjabini miyazakii]|uniref:Uncharacterized protein n=1 Tax=Paragonimus skrjabini miyazakii TaxID=59628 RepID=A0A8S9YF73_9TREM|nr:hypothetical protein EG68_11024 [Paragonimus skrjabini miyazakii]